MRITLEWLSDHVDLSGLLPERIAEALTLKTALIEGVQDQRAGLAGVVVGEVLERRQHPGADRLSLCRVAFGGAEPAHVVCGAPNVAAGQRVFFAPVGTSLPNGLKLKAAKIRGEVSEGMICAEDELGLGPEHDGILVLPAALEPGLPAGAVAGYAQVVFEIDNKSITHRPDLWGHHGFARELAAIFRRELREPAADARLAAGSEGPGITLEGDGCRLYAGLCIENAPQRSPDWLRYRLLACGLRPRNHLVDLSNFVMLDLGQPTHPFDRDQLAGDRVVVRRARAGERLVTLDGAERVLAPEDVVIADQERVVALAGLMGGSSSEVTEATRRVFLESASFDPQAVRRTSSRLGLRTDAVARFEKSLDPALVPLALRRYARLLRDISPGARVAGSWREAGDARAPERRLEITADVVRARLGVAASELDDATVAGSLRALGFTLQEGGAGRWSVGVPSWRARDVTIVEDLIEEAGRIAGYERVPVRSPRGPLRVGRRDPVLEVEDRLRDMLARQQAFTECVGYSTVTDAALEAAGWGPSAAARLPRLRNPLQQDAARLRPAVAPGLLARLETWLRHDSQPRLFEVGRGYASGADGVIETREVVALLATARARDARDIVRELAGVAADGLAALGHQGAVRRSWPPDADRPWFHARRSAVIELGGAPVGWLGAVAPDVLARLQVKGSAGLLVLDAAALAARPGPGARYVALSRFPPARIDLAFVLPYDVSVDRLREALAAVAPRTLRVLEPFDVWRGPPLGEQERSVAWHLEFQAPDRTLTDADIEKARARLVAAAQALGCRLR